MDAFKRISWCLLADSFLGYYCFEGPLATDERTKAKVVQAESA